MPKIIRRGAPAPSDTGETEIKDFFEMISPSVVKFNIDHYIFGSSYRCVYALREYPTSTDEQAILRHLGERDGVTLHIYTRHVTPAEEKKIISGAASKNRLKQAGTNDIKESVTAQANLQDVATLVATMHRNREPLLHVAVYIELIAHSLDGLKLMQAEIYAELIRSKLNVDKLLLRQQEGFQCVHFGGHNAFGIQFERVLPASSTANLYPFSYSGRTDECGFPIGRDRCGANVILDINKRAPDKTNGNVLILGGSGQGKSHLLKLLLCNARESGFSVAGLDPEAEYEDLTEGLGGTYIDMMSGRYIINVLEPKLWSEEADDTDDVPVAFHKGTRLSQHLSFLKDFFRSYKAMDDRHVDTLEIMLDGLYDVWGINDDTDFAGLASTDYPILSDLYDFIDAEYQSDDGHRELYTTETLREILLSLHSLCKGADSQFFNGHTNIKDSSFVMFGVKGLTDVSQSLRNTMLFNILSFMSNMLLSRGDTVASIDELYLFLTNMTVIEYIRNFMKRVRKKNSAVIIASQNLDDFDIDGIREYTKPLFSIPTHQFLFNAGSVDAKFYIDSLQLEQSEYELIKFPQRGSCLFKSGNERYHLDVVVPDYKAALFGNAGGR